MCIRDRFPVVLDQILGDGVSEGAQNVGTLEIPIERIVGVKSAGRISAFSAGFFPLLDCESEFAMKWMTLCRAHQGDEGIRDPIICYEYLGNFYVQEGNKRLSVLKYYGAIRIPSVVYRIVPPMSDNPEIRAYYEFLDFFKYTRLYDALYTHPGCYIQLLALTNLPKDREWTEEDVYKRQAPCSTTPGGNAGRRNCARWAASGRNGCPVCADPRMWRAP